MWQKPKKPGMSTESLIPGVELIPKKDPILASQQSTIQGYELIPEEQKPADLLLSDKEDEKKKKSKLGEAMLGALGSLGGGSSGPPGVSAEDLANQQMMKDRYKNIVSMLQANRQRMFK